MVLLVFLMQNDPYVELRVMKQFQSLTDCQAELDKAPEKIKERVGCMTVLKVDSKGKSI